MESSRKEDQLVSRYKISWCIQVLHSRMSRKVLCREQRKKGQEMKGCLGDSQEGGNSGENLSDLDALFLPLSLSISMKRKVIAFSDGCEALVDTGASHIKTPGRLVNNIQKLISARLRGSKVKGHAPGYFQSPNTTRNSRANLSPSLSNCTTFIVLWSIPFPLLSSPSMASTTQCQFEPTSSG